MTKTTEHPALTTGLVIDAVSYARAPRPANRSGTFGVNYRVVCADGFKVSVQASSGHYANDSGPEEHPSPYWRGGLDDVEIFFPFTTFEVGATSADPEPAAVWDEFESGGIWAWVPSGVVADLLNLHGGAVSWDIPA